MFGKKAMAISEKARSEPEGEIAIKDKNTSTKVKTVDAVLIVFGRDDKRKAHASRFGAELKDAAIRAAHVMGFHALAVNHPAMKAIADGLPEGRVFESGKAFVPFVKEGTFLALEGHFKQFPKDVLELSKQDIEVLVQKQADADPREEDAALDGSNGSGSNKSHEAADVTTADTSGGANDTPPKSDPHEDWVDVKTGTRVLAVDDPDDGWWEAKVTDVNRSGIGTHTGVMLTLKWVEYPDEPSFKRQSNEVAYFHPAYGQTEPVGNEYSKAKGKTATTSTKKA